MTGKQVEILLVEDNEDDIELTRHALRKGRLANSIEVARGGEDWLPVDAIRLRGLGGFACQAERRCGADPLLSSAAMPESA